MMLAVQPDHGPVARAVCIAALALLCLSWLCAWLCTPPRK